MLPANIKEYNQILPQEIMVAQTVNYCKIEEDFTCLQRNQREATSCLVKLRLYRETSEEVISSKIGSFSFSTAGS